MRGPARVDGEIVTEQIRPGHKAVDGKLQAVYVAIDRIVGAVKVAGLQVTEDGELFSQEHANGGEALQPVHDLDFIWQLAAVPVILPVRGIELDNAQAASHRAPKYALHVGNPLLQAPRMAPLKIRGQIDAAPVLVVTTEHTLDRTECDIDRVARLGERANDQIQRGILLFVVQWFILSAGGRLVDR